MNRDMKYSIALSTILIIMEGKQGIKTSFLDFIFAILPPYFLFVSPFDLNYLFIYFLNEWLHFINSCFWKKIRMRDLVWRAWFVRGFFKILPKFCDSQLHFIRAWKIKRYPTPQNEQMDNLFSAIYMCFRIRETYYYYSLSITLIVRWPSITM